MNRLRSCCVLFAMLTALSACHRYVPAEPEALPPGRDVRVHLTREGMSIFDDFSVELDDPAVEGTFVRADEGSFLFRVPVATRREGLHTARIDQQIRVPTEHVVQFERKELDRTGTALLVAGGTAAVAGFVFLLVEGSEGRLDDPPPEPPETILPLLAVPVP